MKGSSPRVNFYLFAAEEKSITTCNRATLHVQHGFEALTAVEYFDICFQDLCLEVQRIVVLGIDVSPLGAVKVETMS